MVVAALPRMALEGEGQQHSVLQARKTTLALLPLLQPQLQCLPTGRRRHRRRWTAFFRLVVPGGVGVALPLLLLEEGPAALEEAPAVLVAVQVGVEARLLLLWLHPLHHRCRARRRHLRRQVLR